MNLRNLILAKVRELSPDATDLSAAAKFFECPEGDIDNWESGDMPPLEAAEKIFVPREVKKPKVAIALPWYKSTNPVTAFSVMSMIDRTRMAVMLHYGDAFIVHTRNKLADNFLKGDLEWMLTIDDDMIVPFGNAPLFNAFSGFNLPEGVAGRSTVDRLLSHGKTLVGGLYYGRWKHGKPVFAEGSKEVISSDSIAPTKWVGTGCMLIHRSVFLDIEKKFPHLARGTNGSGGQWFTSSEHDLRQASEEIVEVLQDDTLSESARKAKAIRMVEDARIRSSVNSALGTGEDVQFCVRAAQAGHQPYVDAGLVCGHIGSHVYGPK